AAEGRVLPIVRLSGHDIDVIEQNDRSLFARSLQTRVDTGSSFCGVEDAWLDAVFTQHGGEKLGALELVARRIGRVYLYIGREKLSRFLACLGKLTAWQSCRRSYARSGA